MKKYCRFLAFENIVHFHKERAAYFPYRVKIASWPSLDATLISSFIVVAKKNISRYIAPHLVPRVAHYECL